MNTTQLIDHKGKARRGKKVVINTVFDCPIDQVWQRIQNVSTLVEICKPMARFTPHKAEIPTNWAVGKTYDFDLYLYSRWCGRFYQHRQRKWKAILRK